MGFSAAAAATVVSGYMQSQASKSAAQQQQQAAAAAQSFQQRALAQQTALERPYTQAGTQALQQLTEGLQPGGQYTQQFALQHAAQQGMTGATPFQATTSPAQQFAQQQAMQAMRNQMALGGQNLSSNAIVGAGKLAGGIASQYEQQAYNQWLAGRQQILAENQSQMQPLYKLGVLGQAAASGQAANIGQSAQQQANLQIGGANAAAAGQVGSAQALSSTLQGLGGIGMQYSLAQKQPGTSGGNAGGGTGGAALTSGLNTLWPTQ
jgi:hypothetical protein